eukprot:g1364.t1
MSEYTEIKVEVKHKNILVVSLNRKNTTNAISRKMNRQLDQAFRQAELNDRIKVIIIRSEGKHFSSGHDLGSSIQLSDKEFPQQIDPRPRGDYTKWYENDVEACLRWRHIRKPVLCGIKGYCIYHGTVVSACADIVYGTPDLKYMPSLVENNIFPWAANLNIQQVKEIIFTQRFVLANEALKLGIISRIVSTDKLDNELINLARVIARGDSHHLWMMKKMSNAVYDSAGIDMHIRSGLDTWATYRHDSQYIGNVNTKDHGGNTKRLAPVESSLRGDKWKLSLIMSNETDESYTSKL